MNSDLSAALNSDLSTAFRQVFGIERPHDFQIRLARHLFSGRSVILQAPTGSGKTKAALFPFLYAWQHPDPAVFPRQGLYVIPLRVLANQFYTELSETTRRYVEQYGLSVRGDVRVQTGEHADDPRLEADLTFTTVDQFLSSMLTIPYSLGNRLANLNAGAAIGSYLVFDEFHLFPVDDQGNGALATTLYLLKMLRGITPFVLMTATFSSRMIDHLCTELDAVPVTLTEEEVNAIPSQRGKQRRYRHVAHVLDAESVINDTLSEGRQRVICVCNTVDRAQALTQALRSDSRLDHVRVELLHSRFYQSDRKTKEELIRREFGEDRSLWQWGPAILVATQVIEVGLNITCNALHTEMAPASAIIQRAGRCARFTGESGDVLVYDVPTSDDGVPDYAPYIDTRRRGTTSGEMEGQFKLCERTREVIAVLPASGKALMYHDELALVDQSHTPFDERMLALLHDNHHALREEVERVFRSQDRRASRDLIRDIDSRTVIVHLNPNDATLPFPYRLQGINIRRNTLLKWCAQVQDEAMARALDWVFKTATPVEDREKDDTEGPEQLRANGVMWLAYPPASDKEAIRGACDAIIGSFLIAINPALVQYDTLLGFRFGSGMPAPDSPLAPRKVAQRPDYGAIRRETYAEHIAGLYRVYTQSLHAQTAAVRRRLEEHLGLIDGTLDRAIRLMFAVHDLGKLDRTWQAWAHAWQEKVSRLRSDAAMHIGVDYMAAHTDFDSRTEAGAERTIQPRRPPHAAESARAGEPLLSAVASECDALYTALMTAIICHHGVTLRENHGPWKPVPIHAKAAFDHALRVVGLFNDPVLLDALQAAGAALDWHGFEASRSLSGALIDPASSNEVILYLILVRILRLADQGSQEKDEDKI